MSQARNPSSAEALDAFLRERTATDAVPWLSVAVVKGVIDAQGRARAWGQITSIWERHWRITWEGAPPDWAGHFSTSAGLWQGFPFFLGDLRPQGFLGRALARRLAQSLPVSRALPEAEHPKWHPVGDPAMIDWFFWMFRQVVCWAKRGAQQDYRAYDKLSNAVSSLADVRTRLVEMRLWTLGHKDYLARADRLETEKDWSWLLKSFD